jgi:hypothetical protein
LYLKSKLSISRPLRGLRSLHDAFPSPKVWAISNRPLIADCKTYFGAEAKFKTEANPPPKTFLLTPFSLRANSSRHELKIGIFSPFLSSARQQHKTLVRSAS